MQEFISEDLQKGTKKYSIIIAQDSDTKVEIAGRCKEGEFADENAIK